MYKALRLRHPTCRECIHKTNKVYFDGPAKERHLQQVKDRKHEARQLARNYIFDHLQTHSCSQCGESDIRVLEFHHVHGKDMTISAMVSDGYSIDRIQAGIDKSVVLCANCHRKITVEEGGWFRAKKMYHLKGEMS